MDDLEKFYNKTLRYLSFRPRSEKEIRDYLHKKDVPPEIIKAIISKLNENKFLNDEEFAKLWIEQRTKLKPKAWNFIKFELKQKGITKDIINNLSKDQNEDEDLKRAKKLIEKKIQRYKNLDRYELYRKLGQTLASKGFRWDIAKRSIDELIDSEYNEVGQ